MSSVIVVPIALALFSYGYWFYARRLQQLWDIDPKRSTPAFTKYDSIDYIPAKNWLVLFGHHFASIAGAGPIIGPVIAVMLWGWLPALAWVVLGSIFIGGVHDFGSLAVSVREGGSSTADIAGRVISKRAKIIFSLFVWLALILIVAVFAFYCADTFVKEPKIIVPSLGLIPVAMLVGWLLYGLRVNAVLTTALGLVCLTALIFLGHALPVPGSLNTWIAVLLIYCYIASILPVNILLQPRDYLSSFLLFFGVGAGYVGLAMTRPILAMPAYRPSNSSDGLLWPALFITVACGAVSGFHTLVASGTSSKQIASERHIKRIGYGAMIAEGLVAVLAIIATAALVGSFSLKTSSPISLYAQGYGVITRGILGGYGGFIAVTILNAFILTTLDTATRIARYLTAELFGIKNRYFSTTLVILASAFLAVSGKGQRIWQVFGATNQLMAALALVILSCWLIAKKKPAAITLIPAAFMLVTTCAALGMEAVKYFFSRDILLLIIVVLLLVLTVVMLASVIPIVFIRRRVLT